METVQASRAVRVLDRSEPADSSAAEPFRRHIEPLIERLEAADWGGSTFEQLLMIRRRTRIWREPSRQRELSFLLDSLLPVLAPGRRCLCVGLDLLPLAYALSARSVWVDLSDQDPRQVRLFRHLRLDTIWGSWVDYSTERFDRLTYPRATFDAAAWLSAPAGAADHRSGAQDELLRVLKPGGMLAVAPDRRPRPPVGRASRPGPVGAILRLGLWKTDVRGSW
jgi:SAM-dependent methyltransferase